MNKTCSICGNVGEPEIKDGKYICKTCGCTIGAVPAEEKKAEAPVSKASVTVNSVECPICKNKNGNTVKDGKCKCALCGTEFDPQANDKGTAATAGNAAKDAAAGTKEELEKERNKNIIIGAVFLLFFWPVSVYFFYKAYQISKNL